MAAQQFETDIIKSSAGDIKITFIGHGTLMIQTSDKVIHIDPWSKLADYAKLAQADIILITHEHVDHLDPKAVKQIRTEKTTVLLTKPCALKIEDGIIMANGDTKTVKEIKIAAVPAYNIKHRSPDGALYHPEGVGNGYILTIGETRIYIAGDTENTPEMKAIKDIDIAFLPMNLPYTMTPEMVADAAKAFKPKVLYPYHYSETDPSKLTALLAKNKEIEVRIRKMK